MSKVILFFFLIAFIFLGLVFIPKFTQLSIIHSVYAQDDAGGGIEGSTDSEGGEEGVGFDGQTDPNATDPNTTEQTEATEGTTSQDNPASLQEALSNGAITGVETVTDPNGNTATTYTVVTDQPVGEGGSFTFDNFTVTVTPTENGYSVTVTENSTGTSTGSGGSDPISGGVDAGDSGSGSDPGPDGGGDDGYVPPPASGPPVQTLTSVIPAGCSGNYPLVRYDFTASYSHNTLKFEIWRYRRDLDNWSLVREVAAPGSYLDSTLDSNSYQATYVEYFIRRIDNTYGNLDSNHIQINVENCNTPPPGTPTQSLTSATNAGCSGVYPLVNVSFNASSSPTTTGFQIWRQRRDLDSWTLAKEVSSPGTYTDDRLDSNSSSATYTEYFVRRVDGSFGNLDSNHLTIRVASCVSPSPARVYAPTPTCQGPSSSRLTTRIDQGGNSDYYDLEVIRQGRDSDWVLRGGFDNSAFTNGIFNFADEPVYPSTYYIYRVKSYNRSMVDWWLYPTISENSGWVLTNNCEPPPPFRITETIPSCVGNRSVFNLRWTESQNRNQEATRYRMIELKSNGVQGDASTYNLTYQQEVTYGTQYQYNIEASNQFGASYTGWTGWLNAPVCSPPGPVSFQSGTPRARCVGTESRIYMEWNTPTFFDVSRGDYYIVFRVRGADGRRDEWRTDRNSFDDSVSYPENYQYNIRAVNGYSGTDSGWSNGVNTLDCAAPVTNLYINGSRVPPPIPSGTQVEIKWDSTHAKSCTASSAPNLFNWSGSKNLSGTQPTGVLTRPPDTITYTLTCTNPDNGLTDPKTVILDLRGKRPCLKTTGGDVHSNESISAPEDCN